MVAATAEEKQLKMSKNSNNLKDIPVPTKVTNFLPFII